MNDSIPIALKQCPGFTFRFGMETSPARCRVASKYRRRRRTVTRNAVHGRDTTPQPGGLQRRLREQVEDAIMRPESPKMKRLSALMLLWLIDEPKRYDNTNVQTSRHLRAALEN